MSFPIKTTQNATKLAMNSQKPPNSKLLLILKSKDSNNKGKKKSAKFESKEKNSKTA